MSNDQPEAPYASISLSGMVRVPELEAMLGIGAGKTCAICGKEGPFPPAEDDGTMHRLNAAGRVMHIPWDAEMGRREPLEDDPLWWMSFCDASRPAGQQFLGVAIVQAPSFPAALTRSHLIGVNPGGEVAYEGPVPVRFVAPEWRDRLLSREEAESVPEPEGLR